MSAAAEKVVMIEAAKPEPAFSSAIAHAKTRHPGLAVAITQTECFCVLWRDDQGVCPEEECKLRRQCEETHYEALVQLRTPPPAPPPLPEMSSPVVQIKTGKKIGKKASTPTLKPAKGKKKAAETQPARGKWKGTGKYQRLGYQSLGRPVDQALEVFVKSLGDPAHLPRVWSPINFHKKYSHMGRIVLSQTVSYTNVIVNGETILRFWTNAGGCALIDVSPVLVDYIGKMPGVPELQAVSAGSVKKLRPCTHRFELAFGSTTHEDLLKTIGNTIRMAFRA